MYVPHIFNRRAMHYFTLVLSCLLLAAPLTTPLVRAQQPIGWVLAGQLSIKGATPKTQGGLGWSMAFDHTEKQDTLVAGAPYKDNGRGAVEMFTSTDQGKTWVFQQELVDKASKPAEFFGASVAIRGNTIVVGAPFKNNFTGELDIFQFNGSSWTQQVLPAPEGTKSGDLFGWETRTPRMGLTYNISEGFISGLVTAPGAANDVGESYWFSVDPSAPTKVKYQTLDLGKLSAVKIFLGGKANIVASGNEAFPFLVTEIGPGITAFNAQATPFAYVYQFQVNESGNVNDLASVKLVDEKGKFITTQVFWAVPGEDVNTIEVGSKGKIQTYERDGSTFKLTNTETVPDTGSGFGSKGAICFPGDASGANASAGNQPLTGQMLEDKDKAIKIRLEKAGKIILEKTDLANWAKWQKDARPESYQV